MTQFLKLSLAALIATAAAPAFAHGGDHPMHGGQVVQVGETAFELVAKPAGVEISLVKQRHRMTFDCGERGRTAREGRAG